MGFAGAETILSEIWNLKLAVPQAANDRREYKLQDNSPR
jgi:hypothetical protein